MLLNELELEISINLFSKPDEEKEIVKKNTI